MWELSAKGGEFGEGICSKISEGFGKAVGRSSVLAVLSGFGGAGGDDAGAALWWAGLALAKLRIISGGAAGSCCQPVWKCWLGQQRIRAPCRCRRAGPGQGGGQEGFIFGCCVAEEARGVGGGRTRVRRRVVRRTRRRASGSRVRVSRRWS